MCIANIITISECMQHKYDMFQLSLQYCFIAIQDVHLNVQNRKNYNFLVDEDD